MRYKYNENTKRHDVKAQFSWWSPIFGEDDTKLVRDTLGAAIQPFVAELRDQSNNEDDGEISDQFHGDGTDQDDEKDSDKKKIEEGSEKKR